MNCPKIFNKKSAGFTLIELLVVIGILAVLLSIVLIAINPARQFSQANDTKRKSDIGSILNAVGAFAADNKGTLPAGITEAPLPISKAGANICADLVTTYISALPTDPKTAAGASVIDCTSDYNTGYTIEKDASNRVKVSAPAGEIDQSISITR